MGGHAPIRLTAIEEAILCWERAFAPWTVQYGVTAPRLDADRLRVAWNAALAAHEMAALGLRDQGGGSPVWAPMPSGPDIGPIDVVPCEDDAAVARLGDALLELPSAAGCPLVRAVVARRPEHDVVLVNHSHVLSDAIGGVRLLTSVGRAYRGEADPTPAVDLATARRALASPPPSGVTGLLRRWSTGLRVTATASLPRTRVAADGGGGTGAGVAVVVVDASAVAAARARLGATFDAHLLAAVHVAVDRWNRAHGERDARVGTAFGVNLRPAAWRRDVVANLAAFVSVVTEAGQRADVAAALAQVEPAVEPAARAERARLVLDAARAAASIPLDARRRLFAALPADGFESIAVSNLGEVDEPPSFGAGGRALWAAAPAVPPVGISVLAVTTGGALRLAVGFRRERFDDAGARAFGDELAACLVEG